MKSKINSKLSLNPKARCKSPSRSHYLNPNLNLSQNLSPNQSPSLCHNLSPKLNPNQSLKKKLANLHLNLKKLKFKRSKMRKR